ncbi:hypothetical protein SAMN04489844_0793 [Nocardioides exalbidus]|uniref:Uncharacterized protein n=1 Tax=Nocardioides exalbidus TaxID=402596 RepID=A0A1H4L6M1_9ACTN|nr:hypothetical protein [Nocardioides exalbidus]SEB66353.1 hypothetical protein SAMN04489844_0793 [Nocardioides exalbidus]
MTAMDRFLNSKLVDQYGAALAPSFDFVNTAAGAELDVPREPLAVSAAVQKLVADEGHTLAGMSDDQLGIAVITKKTLMSWENATGIVITPSPQGSHVQVFMENMPGRPKALMDGKKNKKMAQKLAEKIKAAV